MTSNRKPRTFRGLTTHDHEPDVFFAASRRRSCERKTRQLCAQVERTLTFLLESETLDDDLQGLHVEAVEPAPNASRLLVVLRPLNAAASRDLAAVLASLATAKGYWRSQIAVAINRKKVPDLVFQVLPGGGAS
jgi:ribosome-binding factor A